MTPAPTRHPRGSRAGPRAAFTLLEVVLALSIAVGLLSVVLYFYQQMARLRDQTLTDTAELAAVRLFMDRLATELRTAAARPGSFRGDSGSIEFLRCTVALPARASALDTNEIVLVPRPSPLRRLRYEAAGTNQNGTMTGIVRLDEPASNPSSSVGPGSSGFVVSDDPGDFGTVIAGPGPVPAATPETTLPRGNLIPELRYLTFRYWDGTDWLESWTAADLPRGVEINLATDAPSPTAPAGAFPRELFRRIIALPLASSGGSSPFPDPDSSTPFPEDSGL